MKKKSLILKILIALIILLLLVFLRGFLEERDAEQEKKSSRQYAPQVEANNEALLHFQDTYPQRDVILACEEDITDDGLKDLVLIYREKSGGKTLIQSITMVALAEGGWAETPSIDAPREHQKIRFFNMDKDGIMEFLITGDKDGQVGYAVYRIIDGEMINLFGEGMEDCC